MEIIREKDIKIASLVRSLKEGKVLVCPSDTVYGLVADAANKEAVEKVFKIKKRDRRKPVPIFVKNLKMAKKLARIKKKEEDFLRIAWPGKITIILKPRKKLPKGIGKPGKEIGLRVIDSKVINRLLSQLDFPLTATSANLSGKSPSVKIKEIILQFKDRKYRPDLVIDSGNLPENEPSTIIDLTVWPPKILRP